MKMISLVTQIIDKIFPKNFGKDYVVKGVFTSKAILYVFAINRKTGKGYIIPEHRSKNIFDYKNRREVNILKTNEIRENLLKCDNFRFNTEHGLHVVTYIRSTKEKELVLAKSKDCLNWKVVSSNKEIQNTGILLTDHEHLGQRLLFFGGEGISVAHSGDYKNWKVLEKNIVHKRKSSFDDTEMNLIVSKVINEGILVLYENHSESDHNLHINIGAFIVTKSNLSHILWRSDEPVWEKIFPKKDYPKLHFIGYIFELHEIRLFYATEKGEVIDFLVPIPFSKKHVADKKGIKLEKHHTNPVLTPLGCNEWESVATFNPAAIEIDGTTHLLYRAHGPNGMSVIGYASSEDGINFTERHSEPIYIPRTSFEGLHVPKDMKTPHYSSGYGWGGCEDPRITCIDDKIYMIYAAYNGYEQARLAMSYIKKEDFLNHNWNWSDPQMMSPQPTVFGTGNKNGALFPEKINGKYVIFHRIWPNISIDYVDDLDFSSNDKWLEVRDIIPPRKTMWDSAKIGVGAPPIKTKYGWLVIYQSVGRDGKYKIGAMLLDLQNPVKVICRTHKPILEPSDWYENHGLKAGVAYPCGSVVKDGKLFVYYGGADTVVCVATADLETFLKEMLENKTNTSLVSKKKIA